MLSASLWSARAAAKNPEEPETAIPIGSDMDFLDHDREGPFWLGAEANSIFQTHPSFPSRYNGINSFGVQPWPQPQVQRAPSEAAISGLATVFLGYRPTSTTELILDPEIAVGGGLSTALGIAGFTNLDVVRNPALPHRPYVGRAEIHQLIPLSDDWEPNEDRGPISSFTSVPRHRLELRAGKMSTADLFDINPVGSDSHMQFMNWTVDNNGAYDYAADTRGYTYGAVVEYQGPYVEARFGLMLMPQVANGPDLDWTISKNRAENLELEIKYLRRASWRGTLRLLGYLNHAKMGSYATAIAASEATGLAPDVTASRQDGRLKGGFGINEFQELGPFVRAFFRVGWNDGKNESFAYTEVDNTFAIGGDVRGTRWRRPDDKVGLAFVSNGISSLHADYLRRGGAGFILGDGPGCVDPVTKAHVCQPVTGRYLTYARETIVEQYYNVHVWWGAFLAEDVQLVANPGYNSDRGPVWVFSLRGHLEF
ncbi:MAG TPA: carbohydrate porin [Polyangia bacterium]|nr:carbohydrate porin [Polyangia bacterium]